MLDADDLALLTIWRHWRGTEMVVGEAHIVTGIGALPFPGGLADQPAAVIECLECMDNAAAVLRRKPGE